MEFKHIPVLLNEVLEGLKINPSGFYLDCTLGGAGHSSEIVKKLNKNSVLIGFDKDVEAITASAEKLNKIANVIYYDSIERLSFETIKTMKINPNMPLCILIKSDFKNAPKILQQIFSTNDMIEVSPFLDGILVDLGVSSYQIDNANRGFSFRLNAPLDMRMDQSQSLTAKDIVNSYSEENLIKLFYKYGEEEFSKSIAKNIVKARGEELIETTEQLNKIVEKSMPKKIIFSRGGAAKKIFQALRIEVNSELIGLDNFLKTIISLLNKNGRMCVISFHSLEDRIIKEVFKDLSINCICPPSFPKCICKHKATVRLISKKPIIASERELIDNSRASSAKLRIAERL